MVAMVKQVEEKLTPTEAISEEQLAALQSLLEAVRGSKLLSDEELFSLEETIADYAELDHGHDHHARDDQR